MFGGGSRNVPEVNRNGVVRNSNGDIGKAHEGAGRTRAGRRVHVISDDEDDDLPVLKPASTIGNVELIDTSNQHQSSNNDVIMDDEHHYDHEGFLPALWPMAPGNGPPVLIHAEDLDPERQRTARVYRVYESLGGHTASNQGAFVSDQETNLQAHRPSQSSTSNQQTIRTAPPHAQPAIYRPRPGVDVDQQAARYQHLFANSQPTNRQAPRPAQPSVVHQQIPRHLQPAVYRPRPGVDLDQQAARNQLAFAPVQNTHHQVYRPTQATVTHPQAAHPAQASVSVSQRHVQIMANINQAGARNLQAHAYAKAKQVEARNRQALSSHPNAPAAAGRDRAATHNQQAFIANQRSAAAASYEQMLAARNQQLADLARMEMNRPALGSDPYKCAHNASRIPNQPSLTQQHAAHPADRQAQYPSEVIEAADALLYYAGVDRDAHSQPGSKVPMSEHAATYINQWDSGRATLSSSSKNPAINVPTPQLNRPRSAVPVPRPHSTVEVMDTTADGSEQGETAEPGFQALRTPVTMPSQSIDVGSTMGSPKIEILEADESRRSEAWTPEKNHRTVRKVGEAEKHPRGEKEDGRKTSKEHKASDDADIADARKRSVKEEHTEQISDDDADDIEITSWKKLDSNKAEDHLGAHSKAKGDKSIKKGVAYVKKAEPKGRKVKTTETHVG